MKVCIKCKEGKGPAQYYTIKASGKLMGTCKPCDNMKGKARYAKEYR